jgi:hypothetical protein
MTKRKKIKKNFYYTEEQLLFNYGGIINSFLEKTSVKARLFFCNSNPVFFHFPSTYRLDEFPSDKSSVINKIKQ